MLMVLWSGLISFVFGLLLGVVLTVTKPNGILENKVVYQILDKLVSLFRSIPFIILLTWVMPITRALVGTVLYVRGAIVPLVFGSVPFFTRQVESALAELDGGLIEAALSMGSSPLEIIFRVYLKESIAAIARGTTITIVSLLNLTAMAGVAGAGGLGDFAIRYGHDRNMADITNVTVLVLVLIVCVIEFVGGRIVKKNTHYRTVVESFQRYYPEAVFIPSMAVGATDAHRYEEICDTCLRCSPFMTEPAEAASGVHGTNERLLVRSYLQGIRVLIDLMEHANVEP